MFDSWQKILEMIRFSHTLFALPFALLSAVMAWTAPLPNGGRIAFRGLHLCGVILCMVFARSAAMAFNRWADQDIDRLNPRTRGRHLVVGSLQGGTVIRFIVLNSLAFVATTMLFWPNYWPTLLAGPVLLYLLAYSWSKRFTSLAHFWLGGALMAAPISAWIALRGEWLSIYPADLLPSVLLGSAVLLWVAGFDIIYACQDAEFDRQAALHSVPASLGVSTALRLAAVCHAGMMFLLLLLPWWFPQLGLGTLYYIGWGLVGLLLAYEHSIVKPTDLTRVNTAFFQVNAIVSLGLFLVGSVDLLW